MFSPGTVISEFTSQKGKSIVFRLLSESDLHQLTDYINILSQEDTYISFSGETFDLDTERKKIAGWVQEMENDNLVWIVSYHSDELISSASVIRETRRSKHVGTIALSVKKGFREEGIGSKMLDLLEEAGKQMQLRMLELTVFSNNERARHVYAKHGYREVGSIPEKLLYRGKYIDEVVMIKRLSSPS